MDLDFGDVTFHPVLIAVAAVLAVCAIYLLFLRNSVMWGFLCILGIVAVAVITLSPDALDRTLNQ